MIKRQGDKFSIIPTTINMVNKNRLSLTFQGNRISKKDLYERAYNNIVTFHNEILKDHNDLRKIGIEVPEDKHFFDISVEELYSKLKGGINAINF